MVDQGLDQQAGRQDDGNRAHVSRCRRFGRVGYRSARSGSLSAANRFFCFTLPPGHCTAHHWALHLPGAGVDDVVSRWLAGAGAGRGPGQAHHCSLARRRLHRR